jgi:hypothetical protein
MYLALKICRLNHVIFVALRICKGWIAQSDVAANSDGVAIISLGLMVVAKGANNSVFILIHDLSSE